MHMVFLHVFFCASRALYVFLKILCIICVCVFFCEIYSPNYQRGNQSTDMHVNQNNTEAHEIKKWNTE